MPIPDHQRLTRTFFRAVNSAPLFQRFFEGFGVWTSMALDGDSEARQIHEAWEALRCPNRAEIEEALARVNDISREKARFALTERAKKIGVDGSDSMPLERLALTMFLDYRKAFDLTYEFHEIEKAENLHTMIGRLPVPCAPTEPQIEKFKSALVRALSGEGNGPRMLVEVASPHPEKWMAAIPHETFVSPDFRFAEQNSNEIVAQDRRPLYEMILIYYPAKGVLKLRAGRGLSKVVQVAAHFATEILGEDAGFFRAHDVVSFSPLVAPGFDFPRGPKDHFRSVRTTMIRFRKHSSESFEQTLQWKEYSEDGEDVLDQLDAERVSLAEIDVLSLKLRFQFPDGDRDTRTVELGTPNRYSLDETERDRYLERVLAGWGFLNLEAKEPRDSAGLP